MSLLFLIDHGNDGNNREKTYAHNIGYPRPSS